MLCYITLYKYVVLCKVILHIHTHAPANTYFTDFLPYPFVLHTCYTDPNRLSTACVLQTLLGMGMGTANLRTKILDFRGFDSGRILISRGGILMSVGDFPEVLSQRILVGIILVGRLGV